MGERWIKMNVSLISHPAIVTLASRLSVTKIYVCGAVFRFWSMIDEHGDETDGQGSEHDTQHDPILHISSDNLDSEIGIEGFSDAMESVGWLVKSDKGLVAPRYSEHNGPTAKKRVLANQRKSRQRSCHTNVTPMRDKSGTRQDKTRQDKNKKKLPSSTPQKPGVEGVHFSSLTVESIYLAYPRHTEKRAALKAIVKALDLIAKRNGLADPAAWLTDRVMAFAKSPAGNAGEFTPYPATWMNKGRYDDDPKEWSSKHDNDRSPARLHAPKGKYDGIEIEIKV